MSHHNKKYTQEKREAVSIPQPTGNTPSIPVDLAIELFEKFGRKYNMQPMYRAEFKDILIKHAR